MPQQGSYAFPSTGGGQYYEEGGGQRQDVTSSNPYGGPISYVPQLQLNPSSNFQDPHPQYVAQAPQYLQPRAGFPAAQHSQSGYQVSYATTPSGFQAHGGLSQGSYAAPIASAGFNYQYSPPAEHMAPRASSQFYPRRAQEASWPMESSDQYGAHTRPMGSSGVQRYDSALTEQTAPSGYPDPYLTTMGNSPSSRFEGNTTRAPGKSYPEPASPLDQGEMPDILPATANNRRQSVYQGSHAAKVDSSFPQPEAGTSMSYDDNLPSDMIDEVEVEVASSKLARQSHSHTSRGM